MTVPSHVLAAFSAGEWERLEQILAQAAAFLLERVAQRRAPAGELGAAADTNPRAPARLMDRLLPTSQGERSMEQSWPCWAAGPGAGASPSVPTGIPAARVPRAPCTGFAVHFGTEVK